MVNMNKFEVKYKAIDDTYQSVGFGTDQEPQSTILLTIFSEAMRDSFKEKMKILDYGCGSGRYCNFLSQRISDFEYFGLEKPNSSTLWGEQAIRVALSHFAQDIRVNFGFIDTPLEKKAIENCDVVLLLSVFTHTSILETHRIIEKLLPLVLNGGKIIFSMIIGDFYREEGNLYGHTDSFGVTYNTIDQIKEIENKFNVKITLENIFLANGSFKHNIYSLSK
jgi:SAM-dependent methyltransferase